MSNTMTILAGTAPFFGRIGAEYAVAVGVIKTAVAAAVAELVATADRTYTIELVLADDATDVEVLFFDHDADDADVKIARKVEALVAEELSGAAELEAPAKPRGRPRKSA